MKASQPRVRRSLQELQGEYESGNKKPLEDLWRAWKGIQSLPAGNLNSFFTLAGYHGEPFRGAGWGSALYWGGYCNHGNVLFPTWHRAYLLRLEKALQSVRGCKDVMLPYWDETSVDSVNDGIPWALTEPRVKIDGKLIDNPLRSFRLNANIKNHIGDGTTDYSKPEGYETQRYPRSGLVGPNDLENTNNHNAQFSDDNYCIELLNQNVSNWLKGIVITNGQPTVMGRVAEKYRKCLDAPNYTVFSNTTSAAEWNDNHEPIVVSLESPHNSIHLAVGGFDVPGQSSGSSISGANGDMGENDTAGFDPIFFFHHCFVDYVFWLWQQRHDVEIIPQYPGTNSVDGQGPTPGVTPNVWLDLDSPLDPFRMEDGTRYTSRDCLDTETQLGYTYEAGSLAAPAAPEAAAAGADRVVSVSGINRAPVRGSFLVSVFGDAGGRRVHLGTEAVLSRWNVQYCANCQTHLEVRTFVEVPSSGEAPMAALSEAELANTATYDYVVTTHDRVLRPSAQQPDAAAAEVSSSMPAAPSPLVRARLEVR